LRTVGGSSGAIPLAATASSSPSASAGTARKSASATARHSPLRDRPAAAAVAGGRAAGHGARGHHEEPLGHEVNGGSLGEWHALPMCTYGQCLC
jgi:hypothetical protein